MAVAIVAAVTVAGCAPAPPPPPVPSTPEAFAARVSVDAMMAHLQALQDIATTHDGNRADGTAGFEASVDYVAGRLRDAGFDVTTPDFERLDQLSPGKPSLTVGGRGFAVDQASLLLQTPVAGLTGPVLKPSAPAGCAASDYPKGVARGGIAVTDDQRCSVVDKQTAAAAAGAAALVVVSPGGRDGSPPKLFGRGYYDRLTIPVAVAGADAGAALRRTTAPVRLVLDAKTVKVKSRNVVAQTTSGDPHNVVMIGAQLDSAAAGPGINDNGSGVAVVLETALQLGASTEQTNAVRFAFWGGSKQRLAGSVRYVAGLDREQLNDIAMYLNVDEVASPNAGFFTYDGDGSGPPSPDVDIADVPIGSAGMERTLAGYLNLAGRRPADMPLGVGSDDSPFRYAGVPVGGVTAGGAQEKTKTQARLWGGEPGAPFDPNRGSARDKLSAVNRDAMAVLGSAAAFAVATYAASIEGVNGVPVRAKRHRAPLGP